ncbi:MAG: RHS repeat protein, partial [Bacteroidetes bacterium]|nr:RHS repeat protein [Bacteroidota bacterium]
MRLTHNAISNDDNLKAVEEVLAAASCISLHELVQADHPEDQTCPKPSSCFSLAMDYVITHNEDFEDNELTITDPYLIECVGSNIITSNTSGVDLGNVGLLGIYGFDENYTAFTYPYLVPQLVSGTVVDYSIIGIATAPVVPNATFSGFAVVFKINDEEHPREYYYITRYIYCLPRGEEETAPTCNLGVECPDVMDANTQPCEDFLLAEAIDAATRFWEEEIEKAYTDYLANYGSKCKEIQEYIKLTYQTTEHHYTLYYYDQAGNLVQTVPPKGIGSGVTFNSTTGAPSSNEPSHTYRTTYKYNALNQVVEQNTPDGGKTDFWYNRAGQLKLSRNAKQKTATLATDKFSFTKYDEQARIVVAGELEQTTNTTVASLLTSGNNYAIPLLDHLDDISEPNMAENSYKDVTATFYDGVFAHFTFPSNNYRGRVTTSFLYPEISSTAPTGIFNATYYKYDELGNVNSIIQKIDGLSEKRTDYTYDLISGKVNKVSYQPGQVDAFYHKYEYDADNRITNVYTSADNYLWDEDAEYFYYPHGPLARTEIGEDKVQGLDYYYTIHGWLKGVNMPHHVAKTDYYGYEGECGIYSSIARPDLDLGKDGYSSTAAANRYVARDAMAFGLGYYQGDYQSVHATPTTFSTPMQSSYIWGGSIGDNVLPVSGNKGLYNGNIAWMITDMPKLEFTGPSPAVTVQRPLIGMSYQYDQLNRIVKSRSNAFESACGGIPGETMPSGQTE